MARLLIVEDDDSVREFTARALRIDGHEVLTACDGDIGLDMVEEEEGGFDMLLSDIRMPTMDGIELAKRVHAGYPHLPIMLMTGYAEQRERASDLQRIVLDVVSKPFSLADIRSRIAANLGRDVAA